jgi:hypothetical protein
MYWAKKIHMTGENALNLPGITVVAMSSEESMDHLFFVALAPAI